MNDFEKRRQQLLDWSRELEALLGRKPTTEEVHDYYSTKFSKPESYELWTCGANKAKDAAKQDKEEFSKVRLYIAVLDEVSDFMVPTLVAHTMLNANDAMINNEDYKSWKKHSFKKCTLRVNRKEFAKIAAIPGTFLGHENTTLNGEPSCAITLPVANNNYPNVLKFAKMWEPNAKS